MRRTAIVILALGSLSVAACTARSASGDARITQIPAASAGPSVWSVDVVTVLSGERERYRRFLEANWARARATARTRGEIRSYHAVFTPDTSGTGAGTEVVLMTEYPDSTAYKRREEIFQPILAAKGRTLIDGKGTRELTERLESRWYIELLGSR